MINFDDVTKENIKEHNPNWSQISNHPYRILIIEGTRSGKTNLLFNLLSHTLDIDARYWYYFHAKDPYESKFKLLINKK